MRISRIKKPGLLAGQERGAMLIETLIALVILGIISVAFLSGLATASKANIITDEQATAESLARNQMEWVKETDYVPGANQYLPPMPDGDSYASYSAVTTAQPLHNPDDGIQRIAVTVRHLDKDVFRLESYKVYR